MYYVNRHKFMNGETKYGIVDTADGVEEFLDLGTISSLTKRGVVIAGVTLSGSLVSISDSCISEAQFLDLKQGQVINIKFCDNVFDCLYLGKTSASTFWIFDGKRARELRASAIRDGRIIFNGLQNGKVVRKMLIDAFCEQYPSHEFSRRLRE